MNDKMLACLTDPIKAKILLEVFEQKQATAKQLSEKYNQIPQTTLYRHLNKMLEDGILKIAEEHPVRGAVEKVYAIGFDFEGNVQNMMETNDGKMFLQFFTQYMLGIMREFQDYTEKDDINLAGDGAGFTVAPIYATTQELTEALMKIGEEIIQPLFKNTPGGERQLRNFCIITTPPKK